MAKISMAVDLDYCVGCFACQNACKMVNELPAGTKWLRVLPATCQPEEVHGKLYMDRFPVPTTLVSCLVCPERREAVEENGDDAQPLCARSCMGDALFVGSPDGATAWAKDKRTAVFTM